MEHRTLFKLFFSGNGQGDLWTKAPIHTPPPGASGEDLLMFCDVIVVVGASEVVFILSRNPYSVHSACFIRL